MLWAGRRAWRRFIRPRLGTDKLGGGKVLDRDNTRYEIAKLGKLACFGLGQHTLRLRLGNPIPVVEALHLAFADGPFELASASSHATTLASV